MIMVIVFAAFALAEIITIKSLGVGMAIAVFLDATVIRVLLVPATMRLMGRWNWWAPGPLGRLADRLGFSHVETDDELGGDRRRRTNGPRPRRPPADRPRVRTRFAVRSIGAAPGPAAPGRGDAGTTEGRRRDDRRPAVAPHRAPCSLSGRGPRRVSVAERYRPCLGGLRSYWAPVLDVAARGTVDAAADAVEAALARSAATSDAPRATLVDIGTGAGVLVIDAWRRWGARGLRVVSTDASRGMLDAARQQAAAAGIPDAALEWLHGDAAHLPLPDAAADVIVSSFVYQLVPDRHAAFREARRVLRPRGVLALTTWLDVETPFAPADEFRRGGLGPRHRRGRRPAGR
jgi:SAM-dependent methyltransferase